VAAVEVNAFALVLDYKNVADYLGNALGLSESTMEKLHALATFRNPAMALLFDRNLTASLQNPSETLWKYGAIAFIRDFHSSQDILYYLNLKGEVYDSWMFLGVSPANLSSIPVLVVDAQVNATEGVFSGHLWDIYSSQTTASTLVVDTDGFAIGTTIKTILNYTQYKAYVKYLPVDVGFYDLHDKIPLAFFHVPMFYPSWGTGPTYLGTHVAVKALFVRGQTQRDNLATFLNRFLGQDYASTEFANLATNLLTNTSFIKMLDGFFLAFSVREAPVTTNLTISSLTASNLVYEGGGGVNADVTAVVSRRGDWLDFNAIVVRFVITSPSGRVYSRDTPSITGGLLDTPVSPLLPLHIDTPEAGVYRVDAYLMKLEEFGTVIDAKSASFTLIIIGPPDHLDVVHTASSPQEAGVQFDVTVRILDSQGNVVTQYSGTVSFMSSDPNAILPLLPYTYVPILDRGSHTFVVTLKTAGTRTVTATATGVASPTYTFTVDVVPNQNSLNWEIAAVSGDGQSAPRGSPLPQPFVVLVTDGFGNVLQGIQVAWIIVPPDPYLLNPGSLSPVSTITDSAGEASSTLTVGNGLLPGGVYIVKASLTLKPTAFVLFTATAT
jgi:hypothetical protein